MASAATELTDEFREAVTNGQATSVALRLVLSAFAQALDESLSIDLFVAMVALTCRLGLQEAAGCLAKEIVAVELLTIARSELDNLVYCHPESGKELDRSKVTRKFKQGCEDAGVRVRRGRSELAGPNAMSRHPPPPVNRAPRRS